MGNVFVHTMMSLDGFIAGPNDDMSWVFRHAGDMPGAVVDEVIARTGAVLAGRRVNLRLRVDKRSREYCDTRSARRVSHKPSGTQVRYRELITRCAAMVEGPTLRKP